jgi:hypothetical protein
MSLVVLWFVGLLSTLAIRFLALPLWSELVNPAEALGERSSHLSWWVVLTQPRLLLLRGARLQPLAVRAAPPDTANLQQPRHSTAIGATGRFSRR